MKHVRIARHRVDRHKNGVAIRHAPDGILDADGAIGARFVLYINLLAERSRQFLGDEAGAHIRRPTRRKRHNEPDRLGGYAWACAATILANPKGSAASDSVRFRMVIMVRSL